MSKNRDYQLVDSATFAKHVCGYMEIGLRPHEEIRIDSRHYRDSEGEGLQVDFSWGTDLVRYNGREVGEQDYLDSCSKDLASHLSEGFDAELDGDRVIIFKSDEH